MATSISLLADRIRQGQLRRLPFLLLTLVLAAMLAVGCLALSRSSLADVRRIQVVGASHLTPSAVMRLADIGSGSSIVWLDVQAIERRLEASAWVSRATVSRDLPWTVHITIGERRPVAVLRRGSARMLVAANGRLLGPARAAERLPTILTPPIRTGEGTLSFTGAARALGALRPSVRAEIAAATVDPDGAIRLRLRSGAAVQLGEGSRIHAKMGALRDILRWASKNGIALSSISLLAPDAPAVTLGG